MQNVWDGLAGNGGLFPHWGCETSHKHSQKGARVRFRAGPLMGIRQCQAGIQLEVFGCCIPPVPGPITHCTGRDCSALPEPFWGLSRGSQPPFPYFPYSPHFPHFPIPHSRGRVKMQREVCQGVQAFPPLPSRALMELSGISLQQARDATTAASKAQQFLKALGTAGHPSQSHYPREILCRLMLCWSCPLWYFPGICQIYNGLRGGRAYLQELINEHKVLP